VLDGILQRYMEQDERVETVLAAGYARADVERVVHLLKLSEYKRRQALRASASPTAHSAAIGAIRSPQNSGNRSEFCRFAHPQLNSVFNHTEEP
jgi:hypothetical protein